MNVALYVRGVEVVLCYDVLGVWDTFAGFIIRFNQMQKFDVTGVVMPGEGRESCISTRYCIEEIC